MILKKRIHNILYLSDFKLQVTVTTSTALLQGCSDDGLKMITLNRKRKIWLDIPQVNGLAVGMWISL